MGISTETKKGLIKEAQRHQTDTGSADVQISLLTAKINHLAEHMKDHKKDFASRRGLLKMVGMRNSLLKYLAKNETQRYQELIARLGLRK